MYKQIVCSSQLIKVKTETNIQIKKKKTLNSAAVASSVSLMQSEQGRTEKNTASSLKFKICRVKIIVKNVGKSNSWSTSPCLSKAEQSRIIRIRQRQWNSIRVGCKWSKFRFRVHSCLRSDFDLYFWGIFMQLQYRTLHLNRST